MGGGGCPPPLPGSPYPPFQWLRLAAKIVLWRLQCQEDLRLKNFGPPSAGTIEGPSEEGGGGPSKTPRLQTPTPPL